MFMTLVRHLTLFTVLSACGGAPAVAWDLADLTRVAAVADAIAAEPARADAILAENGTDRAAYEALLYDIAGDPARSQAYLAARKR